MCRARWLILCSWILFVPSLAVAQTSDTTPPTLAAFDFNPRGIDVNGSPGDITVEARLTDDLAGVCCVYVSFRSPALGQTHYTWLTQTGGTALDATYSGAITIPRFVEPGGWRVNVQAYDHVGNWMGLDSSALTALGFPNQLIVASTADIAPPVVVTTSLLPSLIDTSGSDQTITADVRITDDVSGLDFDGFPLWFIGYLDSPSAYRDIYAVPEFTMLSGTLNDGVWRTTLTVPRYSETGTWRFTLVVRDEAGNEAWLPAGTFEVMGSVQDDNPPVLTGLEFEPALINTSTGSAPVTVTLRLTDDLAGVDLTQDSPYGGYQHGITFTSPSGAQFQYACCGQFTLISGTLFDGIWQGQVHFPQFSEAGTWKAQIIDVTDRVRNHLSMSPSQLAAASFPTDLVVVRPSLVGDGTVDPGGGTITDDTFGDRASITFPAGVVAGQTDVSIDVFPDPIAVDIPQGFTGPATYFVNVYLTPEPSYPFAAPGVSVTLPLPSFVNPGTPIPLFVVAENRSVQPMPDATTGLQVIGAVNADGLTVTFNGISHFSILVGLLPDAIPVAIDVTPKSARNQIKLSGTVPVQVAILSSPTFDAMSAVNPASLSFGKTGAEASLVRCNPKGADVNGDGLRDLGCYFDVAKSGFAIGDTIGVLQGKTWTNENIRGTDVVLVVR